MPGGCTFGEIGLNANIGGVIDPALSKLGNAMMEYKWTTEGKIDRLNHLLDEATYLMTDMLKFGEHEGECDNIDMMRACTLHNAAFAKRRRALEYFVNHIEKVRKPSLTTSEE